MIIELFFFNSQQFIRPTQPSQKEKNRAKTQNKTRRPSSYNTARKKRQQNTKTRHSQPQHRLLPAPNRNSSRKQTESPTEPCCTSSQKQHPKHNRPNSPTSNSQTKVRVPTPLIELWIGPLLLVLTSVHLFFVRLSIAVGKNHDWWACLM